MANPRKTPTKEQAQWMKENGYTEAQMDAFWKECIDTNFVIRNLNNSGRTWRDMNISCVQQLPTQKERDLAIIAEQAEKEKREKEAAAAEAERQEYYSKHFDEAILAKIDAKQSLTEEELSTLVYRYECEISTGENRRWSRTNTSIVQLQDRFFSIVWEEGLTEYQDNEFFEQPVEVKKHTTTKMIPVTTVEWVAVSDE